MFPELVYNSNKRINQLQVDLQNRDKLKQQNKSTGIIDAEINTSIKYLGIHIIEINNKDNELDQIDNELKGYTNKNNETTLLAKEIQKRRNIYNDLIQKRKEIKKRIEQNHLNLLHTSLALNKNRKNNYESFGQVDVLKMHGVITEQQDEYLNSINEKALNIKYSSQNLNNQIKEQNILIDQLHEDTDFANQAMNKLKTKMDYFLEQSSQWKLFIILFLEIFIFILVIVF